eukprot:366574-Chlamydomonas_euryale.AAC.9
MLQLERQQPRVRSCEGGLLLRQQPAGGGGSALVRGGGGDAHTAHAARHRLHMDGDAPVADVCHALQRSKDLRAMGCVCMCTLEGGQSGECITPAQQGPACHGEGLHCGEQCAERCGERLWEGRCGSALDDAGGRYVAADGKKRKRPGVTRRRVRDGGAVLCASMSRPQCCIIYLKNVNVTVAGNPKPRP